MRKEKEAHRRMSVRGNLYRADILGEGVAK